MSTYRNVWYCQFPHLTYIQGKKRPVGNKGIWRWSTKQIYARETIFTRANDKNAHLVDVDTLTDSTTNTAKALSIKAFTESKCLSYLDSWDLLWSLRLKFSLVRLVVITSEFPRPPQSTFFPENSGVPTFNLVTGRYSYIWSRVRAWSPARTYCLPPPNIRLLHTDRVMMDLWHRQNLRPHHQYPSRRSIRGHSGSSSKSSVDHSHSASYAVVWIVFRPL